MQTARVGAALAEMRRKRGAVRRVSDRVRRDAGLRDDEVLFVVRARKLVKGLRRLGVDRKEARDLAARLVAFGWRDEGAGVIAVPKHRLAELRRLGLLGEVVEHERLFHLGGGGHDQPGHDQPGHYEHAAAILARYAVAVAEGAAGLPLVRGGQAVSDVGSQITVLVMQLMAATMLDLSLLQLSVLTFLPYLADVVIMQPAGVLVERMRHKLQWMRRIDRASGPVLATIPLADLLGSVSLGPPLRGGTGAGGARGFRPDRGADRGAATGPRTPS